MSLDFRSIPLKPLYGPLDLRSRPADIPAGVWRWKQNLAVTDTGDLARAAGFERLFPDYVYDQNGVRILDPALKASGLYHNHDHHHQGHLREPITLLFEAAGSDGSRTLIDASQSYISKLDIATGYWTDLASGLGAAGTSFKAASLSDVVLFTNNEDPVLYHNLGSGVVSPVPELTALGITKAKVIKSFNGLILLMNIFDTGQRKASRIEWCDLNKPLSWDTGGGGDSVASFLDLDYDEEIIAAEELLGNMIVYTTRGIWRLSVNPSATAPDDVLLANRIYRESKTQVGILFYPNTLVSDGFRHYYGGRNTFYVYDPYLPAPESPDWLHRAVGAIYTYPGTRIASGCCDAAIAAVVRVDPSAQANELWISWPTGAQETTCENDQCLVVNTKYQTADVRDTGFSAIGNFAPPTAEDECASQQYFIAASSRDWAIKQIGSAFLREYVLFTEDDKPFDPPLVGNYESLGYNSRGVTQMPVGYPERSKVVRNIFVDHDTLDQADPCRLKLRVGYSQNLRDPLIESGSRRVDYLDCDPEEVDLRSIDPDLEGHAGNFACYADAPFLYLDLVIKGRNGDLAIGGDTRFTRLDFDTALSYPADRP